jgi:hypothetical protein
MMRGMSQYFRFSETFKVQVKSEGLHDYFRMRDIYRIKRQYKTEKCGGVDTKWYNVTKNPTMPPIIVKRSTPLKLAMTRSRRLN